MSIDERPTERGGDAGQVGWRALVGTGSPSTRSRLFLLLAGCLATAAAVGVLRLFQYEDCIEGDGWDFLYDDALRLSYILAAGEIVFLSLVMPRLTQTWVHTAGDAAPARFPGALARRLAIAAGIVLVVSELNMTPGPSAVMAQMAAAAVALLAASVSILLWSVRGSMRGAGVATLAMAALPCLVEFAQNPQDLAAAVESHPNHPWCGPALSYPLIIYFVLRPSEYLPFLAAAASLVALLAARLAWRPSRRPAEPERTS